ncbi:NuoM family protein [Herpetosiphon sp. NSE202]|uniref:complex I subunit 4 family protein n=1 Tax=Herpetosiphon sp. NSE202 TaxID=3351349 RepID=UPI0036325D83
MLNEFIKFSDWSITTLIALSPLVGMLLALVFPKPAQNSRTIAWGVFAWSLVPLGLTLFLWLSGGFNPALASVTGDQAMIQQVDRVRWVPFFNADYFVGLDGMNFPLVFLTTALTPVCILAAFRIKQRQNVYLALMLLLESAMLGYFVSLNFLLLFLFWEFSLVPMFFIINNWGGENRRYSAFKFFVYTMAGSVGMLIIFEFIYLATGTFDLVVLSRLAQGLPVDPSLLAPKLGAGYSNGATLQSMLFSAVEDVGLTNILGNSNGTPAAIIFWCIFVAFAVKLAVWPLHTWQPDTYENAPTSGSMIVSAVMSKMGAYGMIRLMIMLFPKQTNYFAPVLAIFALASILFGAYAGLAQTNLKRLIAYASINHMGYVLLGLAAAASAAPESLGNLDLNIRISALNGVQAQMVAHGFSTAALFFLAGELYERTGTYQLDQFGGLRKVMPIFAGIMGVAMFANLGLPGLAGFVGEFFIFRGAWGTQPVITTIAVLGLIVTALVLIRMYQKIFYGPVNHKLTNLPDIKVGDWAFNVTLPLIIVLLVFGIYPKPLMDLSNYAATVMAQVFTSL